jgi:hypothetical protein
VDNHGHFYSIDELVVPIPARRGRACELSPGAPATDGLAMVALLGGPECEDASPTSRSCIAGRAGYGSWIRVVLVIVAVAQACSGQLLGHAPHQVIAEVDRAEDAEAAPDAAGRGRVACRTICSGLQAAQQTR